MSAEVRIRVRPLPDQGEHKPSADITVSLHGMVIRPGDSLILYSEQRLSDEEFDMVSTHLRAQLPGLGPSVILEGIVPVAVYRPEPEPEAGP